MFFHSLIEPINEREHHWVIDEFFFSDLGDHRREQRLIQLAIELSHSPTGSIPQATASQASLKAAYRFFDNEQIEYEDLLSGHVFATTHRCQQVERVLVAQDTTDLVYTHHPKKKDTAALNASAKGFLSHPLLAWTPDGLPLGLLGLQIWTRPPETRGKSKKRKILPFEQKESYKWAIGLEQTNEAAICCPETSFLVVGDSESDIYEYFQQPREENVHLLVRAHHDRRVVSQDLRKLREVLESQPLAMKVELELPARGQRKARKALVSLKYAEVQLRIPKQLPKSGEPGLSLRGILLEEETPPKEVENPVYWVLLTTEEVQTAEEALEKSREYSRRWGNEVYHKVLKSGCQVEKLQLETKDRISKAVALYAVIAWRVLYATMLGRVAGEVSCEALLEEAEWQALYCAIHEVSEPCSEAPQMRQAVRWIGRLGGFVGRKSDGEPGPVVIWRGFQALNQMVKMFKILKGKNG